MSNSLFVSYSRQEAPFVSVLLNALEDGGLQAWVDYQSLVPGRPWLDQILDGINRADVVLLVVSKASMASKNVELEYGHALEQKKRILLIIFEAVPLPPELQACEWIDFRDSFNKKYKQLIANLDTQSPQSPPPQKGFKTSFTVWITVIVSLVTVAISVPGWWTIFIPALLIPLPVHILNRSLNFYRVRFVLVTLPVVLLLSWVFFLPYQFTNVPFTICLFVSFLTTPMLLYLLASKGMRVWGRPGASAPRSVRLPRAEIKQPHAIPFFIEYAPQDMKYADAIAKGLKKYGHPQVEDAGQAQVCFAVISRFKNSTSIDPEKQIVYPIIVQGTVIEDKNLQRIQWIDFRRGLRNLKNLAILLPEPAKLMKALGVVPISGQVVYPRIIQMLDYFLTLLAFFSVSIWFPLSLEFGRQFVEYDGLILFVVITAVFLGLILRAVYFSRHALVTRQGKLASLGRFILSIVWVGFIALIQTIYVINVIIAVHGEPAPGDLQGSVTLFLPLSFGLGIILIGLFGILNWGDLIRWFPQRQK